MDILNFLEPSFSCITQFLRSGRLSKMAIYQPLTMPFVMPQPGFCSDSMHFRVLIVSGSLSRNGKISRWMDSAMQGFSNARDAFQEAFCYLSPGHLEISLTDALEEYVCKLYQPDAMLFDSLSEGGGRFRNKSLITKPTTFKSCVSQRCQTCAISIHHLEIRIWHLS